MPFALTLSATTVLPGDLFPNRPIAEQLNAPENMGNKLMPGHTGIFKYFLAT